MKVILKSIKLIQFKIYNFVQVMLKNILDNYL